MYKNKTILAIIPARGGSKMFPKKNSRFLLNKPLLAWSVEEAQKSKYIDSIFVSTDDTAIAAIAKKYGAEVPFMRPKYLATDNAKITDVVLHLMSWLKKRDTQYNLFLLLQPTSPLRSSKDIDNSIELLFRKKAEAIVSVCEAEHSPYWFNVLPTDCNMGKFLLPEAKNMNRQGLPKFYRLNGAIYLADWGYLELKKSFFGSKTYAYIMPRERSVDIDTEIDFKLAEILLKQR